MFQFDILCIEEASQEFYNLALNDLSFKYFISFKPAPDNLLTLFNKSTISTIEELVLPSFPFTKLAGYSVMVMNNQINVHNVHLIGNPTKSMERREILTVLAKPNTIIIGDFNESVDSLIQDIAFMRFLDINLYKLDCPSGKLITDPIQSIDSGNVATAYSRYYINPKGFVVGIKENQWESVDNILYDGNSATLIGKQIFPHGGLRGKHVPYLPLDVPFRYTRNFEGLGWPSDHSLNCYEFLIF